MQVIPTHSHLEVEFGATEPTCLAHAHGGSACWLILTADR